jgi:predicted AAA+ superfamily ATPase
MLRRSVYDQLLDWKSNNHQKALLVDGPRQVGKTYLLEEFGRREYRDLVKIDFLRDEDAQRRFGSVRSAERGRWISSSRPMMGRCCPSR